jgi:hypothetical protein
MPEPFPSTAPPTILPRAPGETPMPHAPLVQFDDGRSCIPQHYLEYRQSVATLGEILGQIDFCSNMPIFAERDADGLYLQVGLVGRENYERGPAPRPLKLVYGRRWRIESYTPTSEVIQTAFLALKKAREHEVRELLTVQEGADGKPGTPFSSHQDLPLLAGQRTLLAAGHAGAHSDLADIGHWLEGLRFGERRVHLQGVTRHGAHSVIVDLRLGVAPPARQSEGETAEFDRLALTLILRRVSRAELLHELMDGLIRHSDRHVDERFRYQGFARFSRDVDPLAVAELSLATRRRARDLGNAAFAPVFQQINYAVDAQRAPALGAGVLAVINARKLNRFGVIEGHLPGGYRAPDHGARAG